MPIFHVTHLLFGNLLERNITVSSNGEMYDGLPTFRSGLINCPELWNSSIVRDSNLEWTLSMGAIQVLWCLLLKL